VESFVYEVGNEIFDIMLATAFSRPELDAAIFGGDGNDDQPGEVAKTHGDVATLVDQLRLEQLEFYLKPGCIYSHSRPGAGPDGRAPFPDDLRFFQLLGFVSKTMKLIKTSRTASMSLPVAVRGFGEQVSVEACNAPSIETVHLRLRNSASGP
jgi:hypothetical protein